MDKAFTAGSPPGGGEPAGSEAGTRTIEKATEDAASGERPGSPPFPAGDGASNALPAGEGAKHARSGSSEPNTTTTEDAATEGRPYPGPLEAGEGIEDLGPIPSSAELLLEQAAQLVELRAALAAAERRIGDLASMLTETESVRDAHQTELSRAVERYRTAVLTGLPEVPPGLVSGATIEEVDASLERAKAMVEHIARNLAGSTLPIPNGAPPRRPPDLASLSPLEKIRLGLTS